MQINNIKTYMIKSKNPEFGLKTELNNVPNPQNKTNSAQQNVYYKPVNMPAKYTKIGIIDNINSLPASYYKLSNGQKIIIVKKKGPTVLKTYVKVGSMNEPDNLRGISHFIEHNLFNGTESLAPGEFFKKTNSIGATTNASTNFAQTDYFITSQLFSSDDLENEINMHSDMLQHPEFEQSMLEKEKAPVISEISMVNDMPDNIAVNMCLKNLYQLDSKSDDIIAGSIDNINNMTRQDILNYYETYYTPDNMTTVVVGDVDERRTIELLAKYFNKQAKPVSNKNYEPLAPIQKSIRQDIKSSKTVSSIIAMGFAGPMNIDTKDKIATSLMLKILNEEFLKKPLDNIVSGYNFSLEKIGNKANDKKCVLFGLNCVPQNTQKVINELFKGILALQNSENIEKELEIYKNKMIDSYDEISESADSLNFMIGCAFLDDDIKSLTDYKSVLKSINSEDIKNCAKKYLDLNKVSISVVHPKNVKETDVIKNYQSSVSFGSNSQIRTALDMDKVKEYNLKNNVMLITNDINSKVASFNFSIVKDKPVNFNLAQIIVLNSMLNRGNANFDKYEFKKMLNEKGMYFDFSVDEVSVNIFGKMNQSKLNEGFELMNKVLSAPRFTQEELEIVKSNMKDYENSKEKSPDEMVSEVMYAHLPYNYSRKNFLNDLEKVTLEDVKALYNEFIKNSCAKIALSANFNEQNILDDCNKKLNELPFVFKKYESTKYKDFEPIKENQILFSELEKDQAKIVKGYKFRTSGNIDDVAKFKLMNTILGGSSSSRLFNDLREKQKLAYRVRSNISLSECESDLTLSIGTTTKSEQDKTASPINIKKSLDGFDYHIEKIKNEYVSDEELENAKKYVKSNILNNTELSLFQTEILNKNAGTNYGVNYTNMLLNSIDKVTKQDIKDAANYVFSGNCVTAIVANKETIEEIKEKL